LGLAAADIESPKRPEVNLTYADMQSYMVTGDNHRTARIVAEQLGIRNVMAEVMPASKADKVNQLPPSKN
jgi:cation transport ATPase